MKVLTRTRIHLVLATSLVLATGITASPFLATPAQAITVFDPWNYKENLLTAIRSLEEINRKRAEQQEALNLITQKIQSTTSVESALQITARELGHALGMKATRVELNPEALTGEPKSN